VGQSDGATQNEGAVASIDRSDSSSLIGRLRLRLPAALRSRTPFRLSAAALLGVAAGYRSILFRHLIGLVNRVAFADGSTLAKLQGTAPWHIIAAPVIGGNRSGGHAPQVGEFT
jgi:hypothetical protein